MHNIDDIFYLLKLGTKEIISEEELYLLIKQKKKKLIIKIGFDPTSDSLHLGHYVILKKILDFQKLGYLIHIIIGDFTGSIGDPSGKSVVRCNITYDNIKKNYINYGNYIFKFLNKDLSIIYFNSVWFNFFSLADFIQVMSFSTVTRMLERNDFKVRYLNNKTISLHEFVYPLLQSFDSVFLNTDIEIGGIDQKFNFLLARDIQKVYYQNSQILIMMPILTGIDGINKMSKSLNNCIFLNDHYYIMFCKIMSIPDKLIEEYFLIFGFFTLNEYKKFYVEKKNPMLVKIDLAVKIVSFIYNEKIAILAKDKFINLVSKKEYDKHLSEEIFYIDNCNILLIDFLLSIKFLKSHSDYKRFIKYKAIKVNNDIIDNKNYLLFCNFVYLIQCGKKNIIKVFLKKK